MSDNLDEEEDSDDSDDEEKDSDEEDPDTEEEEEERKNNETIKVTKSKSKSMKSSVMLGTTSREMHQIKEEEEHHHNEDPTPTQPDEGHAEVTASYASLPSVIDLYANMSKSVDASNVEGVISEGNTATAGQTVDNSDADSSTVNTAEQNNMRTSIESFLSTSEGSPKHTMTINDIEEQSLTTLSEKAAYHIYLRILDTKNMLFVLENFYALNDFSAEDSRALGLRAIFGYIDPEKGSAYPKKLRKDLHHQGGDQKPKNKRKRQQLTVKLIEQILLSMFCSHIQFFQRFFSKFLTIQDLIQLTSPDSLPEQLIESVEDPATVPFTKEESARMKGPRETFVDTKGKHHSLLPEIQSHAKYYRMYDAKTINKLFDKDDEFGHCIGSGFEFMQILDARDNKRKGDGRSVQDLEKLVADLYSSKIAASREAGGPDVIVSGLSMMFGDMRNSSTRPSTREGGTSTRPSTADSGFLGTGTNSSGVSPRLESARGRLSARTTSNLSNVSSDSTDLYGDKLPQRKNSNGGHYEIASRQSRYSED